jgi:hypothetical protein
MSGQNIQFFFTIRDTLKIHHWQTREFSTHTAIDKAIEELDLLVDQYVEVYIARFTRPRFSTGTNISLKSHTRKSMIKMLEQATLYLQSPTFNKGLDTKKHSELINIRDEIIAVLQRLLYLFTLQ